MALTGDAKQATGEGKSGPVETELTRPAATALQHACILYNTNMYLLIEYPSTAILRRHFTRRARPQIR